MADPKVFQKIYTRLEAITKATVSLHAQGVTNDELATVEGRLAQVVKTRGDLVTLQVFSGTEGIPTNAEVAFLGEPPTLKVSDQLSGRFFDAYGHPIDGGPEVEGEEREVGGPSVNPYKRRQPSELIPTGIAGIDLNNTIVSGQKIPFFADPDQPYNQVMADVALRADVDKIILGGMGLSNDDYLYYRHAFEGAGALDRIVSFVNTTEDPPVERLLVPDMALAAAEYFAVDKNEKVLVLLTDMTLYADALSIVSNRMDQIPSKDAMPGSLYSDLAKIYEKAVQLPTGGSITIIAVTTLNDGDITHAIPDNTGYITEGQLFLRADPDSGKVIALLSGYHAVGEGDITSVAVHPDYRRKGLAKKLIEKFENSLPEDTESIFLEVRESNCGAIALYEKCGFERLSVRKNFYSQPRENAVVMQKKL